MSRDGLHLQPTTRLPRPIVSRWPAAAGQVHRRRAQYRRPAVHWIAAGTDAIPSRTTAGSRSLRARCTRCARTRCSGSSRGAQRGRHARREPGAALLALRAASAVRRILDLPRLLAAPRLPRPAVTVGLAPPVLPDAWRGTRKEHLEEATNLLMARSGAAALKRAGVSAAAGVRRSPTRSAAP